MAHVTTHPSVKRLVGVAAERGDTTPTKVAKRMNVSPQTFTNWTSRGLSLEGALQAQLVYGCDANWLLGEAKQPQQFGSDVGTLDVALLRSAIFITERAFATQQVIVAPEARAEITLAAYDLLREGQDMQSAQRIVARMLQVFGGATIAS